MADKPSNSSSVYNLLEHYKRAISPLPLDKSEKKEFLLRIEKGLRVTQEYKDSLDLSPVTPEIVKSVENHFNGKKRSPEQTQAILNQLIEEKILEYLRTNELKNDSWAIRDGKLAQKSIDNNTIRKVNLKNPLSVYLRDIRASQLLTKQEVLNLSHRIQKSRKITELYKSKFIASYLTPEAIKEFEYAFRNEKRATEKIENALNDFLEKKIEHYFQNNPVRHKEKDLVQDKILAQKTLAQSVLKFVVKTSKKYTNLGLEYSDLVQAGNLGVLKATRHFNKDYFSENRLSDNFLVYAAYWVKATILHAVKYQSRNVRLPASWQEDLTDINRHCDEFDEDLSISEISEKTGFSEARVLKALKTNNVEISLDEPVHNNNGDHADKVTLKIDTIPSTLKPAFEIISTGNHPSILEMALSSLKAPQKKAIELFYSEDPHTPQETAKKMGVSRDGYYKRVNGAKINIRRYLTKHNYSKKDVMLSL